MSIFESIKNSLTSKKQTSQETYVAIIGRADKPLDGDAERLEQLLKELNISVEQSEKDAGVIAEVKRLQLLADSVSVEHKAEREAEKVARAYGAEMQRIIAEKQAEYERLTLVHGRASGRVSSATEAVMNIDKLYKANKSLFATDPNIVYRQWEKSLTDKG